MSTPEQLSASPERGLESTANAAAGRKAELLKSDEKSVENSPEKTAKQTAEISREAHNIAASNERPSHELTKAAPSAHHVRPATNKAARTKAYKDILRHTQSELPAASRAFSKVIHQPVVEKTSAAAGATIARPNAILFGALFALILSGGAYAVAKYYNYTLSGFEAIGAFIIGWLFGIAVDFVRLGLKRH